LRINASALQPQLSGVCDYIFGFFESQIKKRRALAKLQILLPGLDTRSDKRADSRLLLTISPCEAGDMQLPEIKLI